MWRNDNSYRGVELHRDFSPIVGSQLDLPKTIDHDIQVAIVITPYGDYTVIGKTRKIGWDRFLVVEQVRRK